MLTPKTRRQLYIRLGLRLVLFAAVVCGVIFLFKPVLYLFGPFIFALAIAALLNPMIRGLNRHLDTSRRFLSFIVVLLMFVAVTGIVVLVVYRLLTEIVDFASNWRSMWDSIQPAMEALESFYKRFSSRLPPQATAFLDDLGGTVISWAETQLTELSEPIISAAGAVAGKVASGAVAFLVFIVAAYFMTADYPRIRWKARETIGKNSNFLTTLKEAAGSALGGYLKAQLVLSGIVGLVVLVALLIWKQDYALIISIITALIDFIPFFGSGIVLVPWAVFSFGVSNISKGIFLLILSFGLFIFRKLAEPKIVGNHTGLSPLMSLVSIYVGMKLAGVIGMIFMPVLVMVIITMKSVGAFDNTINDLSLAVTDIRQLLAGGENSKNS